MEIVRRINSMKEVCRKARSNNRKVGLVPTMGALHEGHLSLVRRVRELSDLVVVSIFVNPTQFGPDEDFQQYPRDLAQDVDLCIAEGVDYVFAPSVEEMYPPEATTQVDVGELGRRIEGESRPGHFVGVATVVLKLLEIVRPQNVAFGQKDAQQVAVIRRMVRDLMLDCELLILPTLRDEDGLALSSRNRFLSAEQRDAAMAIPRAFEAAREAAAAGEREVATIVAVARAVLDLADGIEPDYVELVRREDFAPAETVEGPLLLLVAARVGEIRLIDNMALEPPERLRRDHRGAGVFDAGRAGW